VSWDEASTLVLYGKKKEKTGGFARTVNYSSDVVVVEKWNS
jgi:hypothetical protein